MKLTHLFLALAISLTGMARINTGANPNDVPQAAVANTTGIWHDLITPDLDASKAFYKALFDWDYQDKNIKGFKYTLIYNKDRIIGGMIEVPNTQSSAWICSLPLEASALNKRIKIATANGAKLAIQPIKFAGLGKQVVFEAPEGSVFSLSSTNTFNSSANSDTATNSWLGIELWSDNPSASKAFYEQTFEVTAEELTNDNKPYWYFKNDEQVLAGMIKNPVTNQGNQWVPYIKASSLAAIATATQQSGGTVILSPTSTIRNGSLAIIQDPHGALVAIQP